MKLKERLLTPFFFEYSSVPGWLSNLAPIQLNAISFGPFVFCKRKATTRVRQHETIHYRQQLELLFVLQWVLYLTFWLWGYLLYKNGRLAYYNNPFEVEAYNNEYIKGYLDNRKLFSWLNYL
jgi:hypothetical protein